MIAPIALAALWFLGVDKSWFWEECNDCAYQCDVIQYRFFSIPLHERKTERRTPIELVARDLGAPCPHSDLHRGHKHRWWGLCFCAWPCINGITGLSGPPWYDEQLSARVKAAAAENPTLGEEFRRRVVYGHDWNYFKRFRDELSNGDLEPIVLLGSKLSEDKVRQIVEKIELIESLEPKYDQPQWDENAALVLALGERTAPYLVQRITDEQPGRCAMWPAVGDVAHMLLSEIYNRPWPTPAFAEAHALTGDEPYRNYYVGFLLSPDVRQNRENRRKLQQAWKQVVEQEKQ